MAITQRRGWFVLLSIFLLQLLQLPLQSTSFTSKISLHHNPITNGAIFSSHKLPSSHFGISRKESNSITLHSALATDPSEINASNETSLSSAIATEFTESEKKIPFPILLWRFSRPHTLIGSAIAIPSIHLLTATSISSIFSTNMLFSILYALIPSLLMNVYITGLNQITDIEIDKINKPNLPLASGHLSKRQGITIVLICLVVSLIMGIVHPFFGSYGLNITLWGSAILGTLYSLPPFRLKRFPALAALCIVAVRGMVINTGFYSHALSCTSNTLNSSILSCLKHHPKCLYSSLFFGIFGIVIALMKDVPDVKGDAMFKIRSLSVRLGPDVILKYMKGLLSCLFATVSTSFLYLAMNNTSFLIRGCRLLICMLSLGMGWSVWKHGLNVDAKDSNDVYMYYMHLWKLFYVSYFALPFAR